MEHGVGAAAHGDVEGHGIEERFPGGDAAGQYALVAILIVGQCVLHNLSGGILEESDAVFMGGEDGTVAGQGETDGLGQRVHRVGGEHTRAAAATRTGAAFNLSHLLVAHRLVGTLDHGGDKVGILASPSSRLHGSARTEDGRNVQSHGCHEHTRCHLVAVGNANHGIRLMGIHHIFHRVGDDVS